MEWAEFPWGTLITIGVLMLSVALLAMDERNRRKFTTREEMQGMNSRIEKDLNGLSTKITEGLERKRILIDRNAGLFVSLDDRVGDLEQATSLLEERQANNWRHIAEQMSSTAETIKEVTKELKELSRSQQEYALRLERLHNTKGGD
jgi:hypothetical protein